MPLPTGRQVHVDVPLSNISIAYMQKNANSPFGLVADKVFPVVPVQKKSDLYYKYNKGDWFRGGSKRRAPSTESAGGGFRLTTDSYVCTVWALHDDLSEQDLSNQDGVLDLRADSTEWITQNMLIDREVEWATNYFQTGLWGKDYAPGSDFIAWDDYTTASNGDPVKDIEQGKVYIESTTGFTPNTLVVSRRAHARLKRHPVIRDQFKYTSSDSITPAMLARILEIDRYMICGGIKNSAAEGATDAMDFIQGNHALLVYSAPSPALRRPSGGYTFTWSGYLGAGSGAPQIETIPMRQLKSERIEGEMAYTQKLVAADMGVFFRNVVTN